MLRKIRRSIARYNLQQQDIPLFGKYAPKEVRVKQGKRNVWKTQTMQKSYFARSWRAWL